MNLIGAVILLILVITSITYANSRFFQCPSATYGDGKTLVKYYSSTFCTTCWVQKKTINQYLALHPNTLHFEEYDVDFCPSPTKATPSFEFNGTIRYGLHTLQQLERFHV